MFESILSKSQQSDKTIVLVENNPEYIAIFQDAVNRMNCKYKVFQKDCEAWKFIVSNQKFVSLIVSCKLSHNINGLNFLSKLKSDVNLKNIPVIIQSIDKKAGKEKEAIALGARFYIKKPFKSRKLYSLIKTSIRKPVAANNY